MNEQAKHTPGPWEIVRYTNYEGFSIQRTTGSFGCIAERWEDHIGEDRNKEMQANARLIAAAPETAAERDRLKEVNAELIEAFTKLMDKLADDCYYNPCDPNGVLSRARHTLAKAKELEKTP